MSSWAEVTREVCGALGAAEAARAAALVLDAPHHHPPLPPQLARARLHAAQDILKGPLGEDPGKNYSVGCWPLSKGNESFPITIITREMG